MGQSASGSQFFLAHIFFLVVFVALVAALIVVLRGHRQPAPLLLAMAPLLLIFVTAYLAPKFPSAHRTVNIVYDGLMVFNAVYFWRGGSRVLGILYVIAVIGTALDFAMHFVIRIA